MPFRSFFTLVVLISLLLGLRAEDPPAADELGRALITALRDQNEAAYIACWATPEQMLNFLNHLPEGAPTISPEEMKQFSAYYDRLHKEVAESYSALLADMKKKGVNPQEIVFKEAKIRYQTEGGVRRINSYDVIFTANGARYWLQEDDGHLIDGKWLFSDSPAKVVLE